MDSRTVEVTLSLYQSLDFSIRRKRAAETGSAQAGIRLSPLRHPSPLTKGQKQENFALRMKCAVLFWKSADFSLALLYITSTLLDS
jgi:hypothetical protein